MDKALVFDTPEQIEVVRLLALRSRLKLEIATGMTFSSPTGPIIRKAIGSTTKNKEKLLKELEHSLIETRKVPSYVLFHGKGAK